MSRRPCLHACLATLTMIATLHGLGGGRAHADATPPPEGGAEPEVARRLGDHRFVQSSLVEWAFIDSWFVSNSTAGFVEFDFEPDDGIAALLVGSGETRAISAAQSFAAAYAPSPWIALALRVSATGVVPRNTRSTLFIGAHELYYSEASVAVRLLRRERWQLTARASVGWGEASGAVPAQLPGSPYLDGELGAIRPALAAAYAPASWVGLQASASFAWRRYDIRDEDDVRTVRGALAATFALPRLPLTAMAAASVWRDYGRVVDSAMSVALFGSDDTQGRGEVGIYYRGESDLDLGLLVAFERDGGSDYERRLAHIFMGYYF